jgi:hypothetical protein
MAVSESQAVAAATRYEEIVAVCVRRSSGAGRPDVSSPVATDPFAQNGRRAAGQSPASPSNAPAPA